MTFSIFWIEQNKFQVFKVRTFCSKDYVIFLTSDVAAAFWTGCHSNSVIDGVVFIRSRARSTKRSERHTATADDVGTVCQEAE